MSLTTLAHSPDARDFAGVAKYAKMNVFSGG